MPDCFTFSIAKRKGEELAHSNLRRRNTIGDFTGFSPPFPLRPSIIIIQD
jgi:hypothetical protein